MEQLGKSLQGVAGRSPVLKAAFEGLTEAQLRQGQGLDAVLKRLGGSAQAEINTFSGAITQAKHSFENFGEAFGKIIVESPGVIAVIKAARDAFDAFEGAVQASEGDIARFVQTNAKGLLLAFADITEATQSLTGSFNDLKDIDFSSSFGEIATLAKAAASEILLLSRGFVELKLLAKAPVDFLGADSLTQLKKSRPELAGLINQLETIDRRITLLNAEKIEPKIYKDFLDGINPGSKSFADHLREMAAGLDATKDKAPAAGEAIDGIGKAAVRSSFDIKQLRADLEKLRDAILKGNKDENVQTLDILGKQFDEIEKFEKARVLSHSEAEQLRIQSSSQAADKMIAFNKKVAEEAAAERKKQREQSDTVPGLPAGALDFNIGAAVLDVSKQVGASIASSFLANLAGGKEGARAFVGDVGGAIAAGITASPAIGGAIADTLKLLGQDPEAFRAAIDGFVNGIPEIIDNIVKNIPYLVQTLADHSGEIITALANASPQIAIALAKAMPEVAKALLEQLAAGFTYQIGQFNQAGTKFQDDIHNAGAVFSQQLKDLFNDLKDSVTPGSGGDHIKVGGKDTGVNNPLNFFKHASGIDSVPAGYKNDTYLAGLTSGERVVQADANKDLTGFLKSMQSGQFFAEVAGAVGKAVGSSSGNSKPVVVEFKLDSNVLARGLLNLNQRNVRTA